MLSIENDNDNSASQVYRDGGGRKEKFPCSSGCLGDTVRSTLDEVQACKQTGCVRCSLVLDVVERFLAGRKSMGLIKDIMVYEREDEKIIYLNYKNGELERVHLFVQDSSTNATEQVSSHLPTYTGSEESLDWAYANFQTCLETHEACNASNSGPMPRRLLDLRAIDPKQPLETSTMKVLETHGQIIPYFCLSHCWGPIQPLKTLKATLNAHIEHGIPWPSIPKTFQDAVMLTRRFVYDYLWIDSLCIVQDDHQDWEDESKNMCAIYQNAALTICATKSTDSRGGCFTVTPATSRGFVVNARGAPQGHQYTVIAREFFVFHRRFVAQRPLPVDIDSPLLNRAWAFQERLLSPRALHFGRFELLWECRVRSACQCNSAPALRRLPRKVEHQKMLAAGPGRDLLNYWYSVVEDYTVARLSFESDRLPALFGLAQEFVRHSRLRYVAGLWRDSLATDLLWMVSQPPQRPRVQRGTVPSWSWASVCNVVDYNDAKQIVVLASPDTQHEIPLAVRDGESTDPIELLRGEHLVTRGRLAEVRLVIDSARQEIQAGYDNKGVYRLVSSSFAVNDAQPGITVGQSFHADYPLEETHKEDGRTMRSGQTLYIWWFRSEQNIRYSIVLQRLDKEKMIFERVGLLREHLPSDSEVGGSDRLLSDDELSVGRRSDVEELFDDWKRSDGVRSNSAQGDESGWGANSGQNDFESGWEQEGQDRFKEPTEEARENQSGPNANEAWVNEEPDEYASWSRQRLFELTGLNRQEPDLFIGCEHDTEICII